MVDYASLMRSMSELSIAAVNGLAASMGATMTLPCGIRIMADGSARAFIFPRVGLVTELGSSYFLPWLVGVARATEMLLTGRQHSAREWPKIGIVTEVAAPEQLRNRTYELASEIMQG
jgi:enoyl-CoA hydratase/carnithine racemase